MSQMLGGICAAAVSKGLSLGTFSLENSLADGLGPGKGLAIEMFTTSSVASLEKLGLGIALTLRVVRTV